MTPSVRRTRRSWGRQPEVFYSGKDKFPRLLADLAEAKHTITLMYLIWERDELTAKVTEVLLERSPVLSHSVILDLVHIHPITASPSCAVCGGPACW